MVERSLAIPEIRCSNPVICKIYIEHLLTVNCIEMTKKTEIKKKRPGIAHWKKRKQLGYFLFFHLVTLVLGKILISIPSRIWTRVHWEEILSANKQFRQSAVLVAQLVERLLPGPEVRGSNFESSHWQNFIHVFTINRIEKTKKEKRGREWPILK